MKFLILLISLVSTFLLYAQNPTIGLTYTSNSVSDGYTLFSFDGGNDIFLIDNCGEQVNKWTIPETPGLTSYILENGNILIAGKDSLYIRDWNDNPIWTYATTDNGINQHHDIEPLPNGNVLIINSEFKNTAEQISAGKDTSLAQSNFKLDGIVEIQPFGSHGGINVWEWHFWDHLVQNFDNTKSNYGIVADHPELLDINFIGPNPADWTHLNSIDYNADLDQILISSRHKSEIYIIDHSTSTAEAAGHSGGNSGKGGDFLWRWGNPQVYQHGSANDQRIYLQHDAQWIKSGYVNEGKITVFNNISDGTFTYSSIDLIAPEMNGTSYVLTNNLFGPINFSHTWNGTVQGDVMYSSKKGGVHGLPNGGYLVCEAERGRIFEMNTADSIVWVYRNPVGVTPNVVFDQYYPITTMENSTFRATKYPANYIGFNSVNLMPSGIIENVNPISDTCNAAVLGISQVSDEFTIVNPVTDGFIQLSGHVSGKLWLVSPEGKIVGKWESNEHQLNVGALNTGIYFLHQENKSANSIHRLFIIN